MKARILIVDDEQTIRILLRDFFSRGPYEVTTAASAEEALAILAEQPADVVIADEQMPGMNGSELLVRVRDRMPDSVRIVLTGHATVNAAVRAINEGRIYRFFTKPCNLAQLGAAVRQGLEERDKTPAPTTPAAPAGTPSIRELEERHPGITRVRRDPGGAIIIDDD